MSRRLVRPPLAFEAPLLNDRGMPARPAARRRRPSVPTEAPRLVVCDTQGRIFDHPELLAVGVDGPEPAPIAREDWIPLPQGSDFYMLPARAPLAQEPGPAGALVEVDEDDLVACSVFLAPAWTRSHRPAFVTRAGAPALPLYAYAVVGFADNAFWTTGARVDPDPRQDPWTFEPLEVEGGMAARLATLPENRIVQQLERCALEYGCRAAQNYALGRFEAPLPTSVACNAQCVGCISLQPDGQFKASHERLTRRVQPQEIVALARDHWSRVPTPSSRSGRAARASRCSRPRSSSRPSASSTA